MLEEHHLNILWNWKYATDDERKILKKTLLPEDDIDTIVLDVIEHPTLDKNNNIITDWCEVVVYEKGYNNWHKWLCDINVSSRGEITYNFSIEHR